MARPAAITHAIDDDETDTIEADAEDVTELHDELDEQERAIRAEFDGDGNKGNWRVKVYKLGDKTGTRDWVMDCLPSDFPILESLRDMAGPGRYQAYCYNGRKLKILKYSIAPLLTKQQPAQEAAGGGAVMAAINAQSQMMRELLSQLASRSVAVPAAAPSIDIPQLLTAVSSLLGALPRPAAAPAVAADPMALVTGVITLVKDMQQSDREKTWVDILEGFAQSPIFEEMVRSRMAPQQALPAPAQPAALAPRQPQPQPARNPQPTQPQQQPTAEQQTADMAMQSGAFFAQQLQFLMLGAQRNSDPQSYADIILDTVPEQLLQGLLLLDDPFTELVKINPTIEPFRPWFDELLNCLTDDESQPQSAAHAARHDSASVDHSSGAGRNRRRAAHVEGDEGEGFAGEGEPND
jgi:cell division septation protein DedD